MNFQKFRRSIRDCPSPAEVIKPFSIKDSANFLGNSNLRSNRQSDIDTRNTSKDLPTTKRVFKKFHLLPGAFKRIYTHTEDYVNSKKSSQHNSRCSIRSLAKSSQRSGSEKVIRGMSGRVGSQKVVGGKGKRVGSASKAGGNKRLSSMKNSSWFSSEKNSQY